MKEWAAVLRELSTNIEEHFDQLRYRLIRRFHNDPIVIVPYIGYGDRQAIRLRGRVLHDKGIRSTERDTFWDNLFNTYRRMSSHEIPFAVVKAQFGDQTTTVTANEEGYFLVKIAHNLVDLAAGVHPAKLWLLGDSNTDQENLSGQFEGRIVIPSKNAEYGIISDLDDTVIQSDVVSLIKLAKNTFLQNAYTRLPFAGVSAFYRALEKGLDTTHNPIFYVSNSPWNLYDLLTDFLDLKQIPLGPLFLQDIGLDRDQWIRNKDHKRDIIREILAIHKHLPFVLIGDSTEHDPELYALIATENPERIRVIYIRDRDASEARQAKMMELKQQLAELDVPMQLVKDTTEAANHAISIGLIQPIAYPAIEEAKTEDDKPAAPVEQHLI